MRKTATFNNVHFDSATIRSALSTMQLIGEERMREIGSERFASRPEVRVTNAAVSRTHESWTFDTLDEFLADLARAGTDDSFSMAMLRADVSPGLGTEANIQFDLHQSQSYARVEVESETRAVIERVHAIMAEAAVRLYVEPPQPPPAPAVRPRIFIGHGGASSDWQELRNHLRDLHGLDVIAYETGSRSGHSIRDILDEMLSEATFAILVYTPEDEQAEGTFRARQNVIHETGLFQGRLGFPRAIIVRREGVEMLSNLDGVQYLPYTGSIRETFGDVLGAIRREFGAF